MNIEEATGSVRDMQNKYMRGEMTPEEIADVLSINPNAISDWDKMKDEEYVSSYIMHKLKAEETYTEQLLSQGQDNLNICPECFANNKQRKRCCKNMVVLVPDNVMVCCYLGDKNEITKAKFKKKVRELKRSQ